MSLPKVWTAAHKNFPAISLTYRAEFVDNHFAALGTSLEGHLDLDKLAEDIEKEHASMAFFGGVQVREAPSANHVAVVDEDGFVDRRSGLEDWPQLWQPDKETLADYAVPGTENFSVRYTHAPEHSTSNNGQKPILLPKSHKNKVRVQDPSFPDSYNAAAPTITAPAVQPVQFPVRAPRPLTIRKKNKSNHNDQGSQAHRVNKRGARDSFVTKSTINYSKLDGKSSDSCLPRRQLTSSQIIASISLPPRRSASPRLSWTKTSTVPPVLSLTVVPSHLHPQLILPTPQPAQNSPTLPASETTTATHPPSSPSSAVA